MFRTAYIRSLHADCLVFFALPIIATLIALGCQAWLSSVAIASVTLWITIPHHYVTWVRAYGHLEDRRRWKRRLLGAPIILGLFVFGMQWAPVSLLLVTILWDQQHSLMQQHGLARIYDAKAGTGNSEIARLDLGLHWVLFLNMVLVSPFFTASWLKELYRLRLPISSETIDLIHQASWFVTVSYISWYCYRVFVSARRGAGINPGKYVFIISSYGMWYYCSWHIAAVLVWAVAHRIMHGIQYMAIVIWYLQQKGAKSEKLDPATWLTSREHVWALALTAFIYTVSYQLLTANPLADFGFGVVSVSESYRLPYPEGYDVFASVVVSLPALLHYYYDSFLWKLREPATRAGLA